ncbi:unnamed protein product [Camellia sinensis]
MEETFNNFGDKLSRKTVVHNWWMLGGGVAERVVAAGLRCIVSNQDKWYLDHLDTTWPESYMNEPLTNITNPKQQELVIGGEVCMWGEYIDGSDIEQTRWPRAAAAADEERLWSPYGVVAAPLAGPSRVASQDPAMFEVMDEECSKKQLKTRSQEKHSSDILQTDSSLKRSDEEIALLDSYASVKSPLARVISTGRNTHRKRARLPPDEESDVVDLPCPQCGTELAGFQCNQNTIHLQCQACGGMMPSRNNLSVPQHCLGCDRAFCGAYWRAQSVFESDSHPVCSREALKPISEHTITRIPQLAHENNQHEQDITERCISQTGRTLQDVISDWITKLENREIDRTRMPLNHAEMITAATHICSFYHQMQLRGKIAGMDIHVGRSTTVKNMLVKEIMFAVQPGVEICR